MNCSIAKSAHLWSGVLSLVFTAVLASVAAAAIAQTPTDSLQPAPAAAADSESIQAKAEQFVDLLFRNRYYEALQYVEPNLRAELLANNNIVDDVQNFQEMAGAFRARLDSQVDDNLVLVNTRFARITDTVIVIFDDQGQITGFDFPIEPLRLAQRRRVLNQ